MTNLKRTLKNKKGFTLIELIVVIAILAILAGILIPSVMNYIGTATEAKNTANARAAYTTAALEVATVASPSTTYDADGDSTNTECTATITDGEITAFYCDLDGKRYQLADNFEPSDIPASS